MDTRKYVLSLPIKATFEGMIEGKRSRGSSQRRWRGDIKEQVKSGWNELNKKVKEHVEWSDIFCKSGENV